MSKDEPCDLESICTVLLEELARDYPRMDPPTRERLGRALRSDARLRVAAAKGLPVHRLRRTRAYRQARKDARKEVYYTLRRYKPSREEMASLSRALGAARDEDERARRVAQVLDAHSSTRERLADRDAFFAGLLPLIGEPRCILDVGCGVFPLMFPFEVPGAGVKLYLAADRDPLVLAALEAFTVHRHAGCLKSRLWDLREGWSPLLDEGGVDEFDVAFLFKLVPVVARQERDLLAVLRETPARRLVLTGSRQSLTRPRGIEHRQRRVLRRFVETGGFVVTGEFRVASEVALVVERGQDG